MLNKTNELTQDKTQGRGRYGKGVPGKDGEEHVGG